MTQDTPELYDEVKSRLEDGETIDLLTATPAELEAVEQVLSEVREAELDPTHTPPVPPAVEAPEMLPEGL